MAIIAERCAAQAAAQPAICCERSAVALQSTNPHGNAHSHPARTLSLFISAGSAFQEHYCGFAKYPIHMATHTLFLYSLLLEQHPIKHPSLLLHHSLLQNRCTKPKTPPAEIAPCPRRCTLPQPPSVQPSQSGGKLWCLGQDVRWFVDRPVCA